MVFALVTYGASSNMSDRFLNECAKLDVSIKRVDEALNVKYAAIYLYINYVYAVRPKLP